MSTAGATTASNGEILDEAADRTRGSRSASGRHRRRIAIVALCALAAATTAIVSISAPAQAEVDLTDPTGPGQALSGSGAEVLWKEPTIPVCWEASANTYPTERGWVEDAVDRSWEAVSNVDFTGWGVCTPGSRGVRIGVTEGNPVLHGIGNQVDGAADGMELNFSYATVTPGCADPAYRESCIRKTAVHEFGHALGFTHEHLRDDSPGATGRVDPDSPDACPEETDPSLQNGDEPVILFTGYDPESVMNYCISRPFDDRDNLTAMDVAGVRLAYGPWRDGVSLPVRIDGRLAATDDEWLTPDVSDARTFTVELAAAENDPSPTLSESLCVGDEVLLEASFQLALTNDDTKAVITIGVDLYESAQCDRSDLEASVNIASIVRPGPAQFARRLASHEPASGDSGSIDLTVTRQYDLVAATQSCGSLCDNAAAGTVFASTPPGSDQPPTIVACSSVEGCDSPAPAACAHPYDCTEPVEAPDPVEPRRG